tara:strand:- start:41099 stop:42232 length:1134 start_codon:yes stop_codon:yes gene_type:complete
MLSNLIQKIKNSNNPFYVFRKKNLKNSVEFFLRNFNGNVIYALKANAEPLIIKNLIKFGINRFDAASLNEIILIRKITPHAEIFFMNPVKSRESIKLAYFNYGVKNFVLDSLVELKKINEQTNFAQDLNLFIRLDIPNKYAKVDLSKKFGVDYKEIFEILNITKNYAFKTGICFHIGSQCYNFKAYTHALKIVSKIIEKSNFKIDFLNVGGGFPSSYADFIPQNLKEYFNVINSEFKKIKKSNITLLAEPGRIIVSDCMSLIVRVELRKKNNLYINDGVHGGLRDALYNGFNYPVRLVFSERKISKKLAPFSFYGPTCDSNDYIKGPFYLPKDISEGDFIEIGKLGAYSKTLSSNFNGFEIDKKIISTYDEEFKNER